MYKQKHNPKGSKKKKKKNSYTIKQINGFMRCLALPSAIASDEKSSNSRPQRVGTFPDRFLKFHKQRKQKSGKRKKPIWGWKEISRIISLCLYLQCVLCISFSFFVLGVFENKKESRKSPGKAM